MTEGPVTPVVFIDSSIPMYVIGGEHPNRAVAQRLVSDAAMAQHRLVTDAEVLPIERIDVERARRLVQTTSRLPARNAVHIAVMHRHAIDRVMSLDTGFDDIIGLTRLS